MITQLEVTVQPQVLATVPDRYILNVAKGVLTKVGIRPAPGPNWEVYTRILHFENAIIPDDNDEWIPLEREALYFYPEFSDWKGVYSLTIEICSPEARFPHTVQFDIDVSEKATSRELMEQMVKAGL